MANIKLLSISTLEEKVPVHALASKTDLVIIKYGKEISVLYGRCHHRGALLGDGYVDGENLICGLHGWDYRYDTGISEYNNDEKLHKFTAIIDGDTLSVSQKEIEDFEEQNPPPFNREDYLGAYADTAPVAEEPYTLYIKNLSKHGLKKVGHHGETVSMGVDRNTLPKWENIQYLPAQLSRKPLLDDAAVSSKTVIGPDAKKPLVIDMPIFVSDMSFGALSKEAKLALAKGAAMSGTGIASGEGGMMPEEQESNPYYFFEYASAGFGFKWELLDKVQAFHFKAGQGAKSGVGGHLPGNKVSKEIAEVRGLKEGQSAISPATFKELKTAEDFKAFANKVREKSGGIPIGFKMAAGHIEADIQFALDVGVDYIILDGRGGGTGAAPSIIRNNINVPTIPALARARKYLDEQGASHVSLIITGGLRVAEDFAKAMMLGADGIAIANSAMQAIGCIGMRACASDFCPVGIATQKESLRKRLIINSSAKQLHNYLEATNELMKVISRSCGYDDFTKFNKSDLTTFDENIHKLSGIHYAGF